MNNLPPLYRDQRETDVQHLNVLAIFHFVVAGLSLLGLSGLALHYMLMSAIISNPKIWQGPDHAQLPPNFPQDFFGMIQAFYIFIGLMIALGFIGNLLSGLFLRARKQRTFSLIVAAFDCLQVPFGTVLGVFTIVVLIRPSVRELYDADANSHRQ